MKRRNFSPEFKRESAQRVVDQNYTVSDAARAMDVGLSTMTKWVKQLRDERQVETKKDKDKPTEQDDGGSHPLATLLLLNESLAVDRMLKIRLRT